MRERRDLVTVLNWAEELKRLAQSIAAAHGLSARVEMPEGTPPLVNVESTIVHARQAVTNTLGADALVPLGSVSSLGFSRPWMIGWPSASL